MRWPWEKVEPLVLTPYPTMEDYDRAYEATEPRKPVDDLPPLTVGGTCPKCGSAGLTTEYYSGVHSGCADFRMRSHSWFGTSPQIAAIDRRVAEAAVEHHDRSCCNCKYRWVEAIIEVPA